MAAAFCTKKKVIHNIFVKWQKNCHNREKDWETVDYR
jgi:hypothetical protein